jgi:raffinose/stachyose/melibiose transport system substrate-binding protein
MLRQEAKRKTGGTLMQRRARRFLYVVGLVLFAWLLSACGSSTPSAGGGTITLTVSTNVVGDQAKVLEDIAHKFEQANPNIKVNFSAPGANYETLMKVKMASGHLPDVFSTHGWAKIRYGKFLADLRDQSWASQLSPTIKPAVTDDTGKVYVLPMDQDKSGPIYNADILKQYGIAVPSTFDELVAACQTILDKSHGKVTPIHIGGADAWPIGQFFDFFATASLISPQTNYQTALLNGSFDWSNWTPLAQKFQVLQQKGCLNKDVLTAKYTDSVRAFAQGEVAFGIYGPFLIDEVHKTNPSVNLGLMPIPSVVPGDVPTFAGGEKTTWGVWKDSPHLAAAKQFVAFYAQSENDALVAQSEVLPPGLTGVQANLGAMATFYQTYTNTPVFPYFDRVYLPNGMWDVMCKNGQDLLAKSTSPGQFSTNMKQAFDRLRASSGS